MGRKEISGVKKGGDWACSEMDGFECYGVAAVARLVMKTTGSAFYGLWVARSEPAPLFDRFLAGGE